MCVLVVGNYRSFNCMVCCAGFEWWFLFSELTIFYEEIFFFEETAIIYDISDKKL